MARTAKGGEAERAARRLLTLLKSGETSLRGGEGAYTLCRQSASASRQQVKVADSLVKFCVDQDWLQRNGDELVLSAAGQAWLRRSAASVDPFREQHQLRSTSLKEIEGTRRPVVVNDGESPLGWLKSRKDRNGRTLITEPQYEAGERLRADYWFAQLSPRVTANWSALAPSDRSRRAPPSHAASMRDDVIAAKARVNRALQAVGPELAGVLIDVCCELKGLEEAEKDQGWPQRAGKVVLQLALTRLARHYGLAAGDESVARGGRGLRHWGSEDYKPTIDAWREPTDQ